MTTNLEDITQISRQYHETRRQENCLRVLLYSY